MTPPAPPKGSPPSAPSSNSSLPALPPARPPCPSPSSPLPSSSSSTPSPMEGATNIRCMTAEEVRATALKDAETGQYMWPLLQQGQRRVELLSVAAVSRGATITVVDKPERQHSDNLGTLELTGMRGVVSGNWSLAIRHDLIDESEPSSEDQSNIGKLHLNADDTSVEYDKLLSRTVNSLCGPVEVMYAVLSDAVEANVQVKFVNQYEEEINICGKIIACSTLSDMSIVLFNKEDDDKVNVVDCESEQVLPLARSVFAVPLIWPLFIDLYLHQYTTSDDQIVNPDIDLLQRFRLPNEHPRLKFFPELCGTHMKYIGIPGGTIVVYITWSNNCDVP